MRFWAVIFTVIGILSLVRPPPGVPEGELIRPRGYFCDSEEGMKRAIAAISATEQPVNYDQLPKSDAEERRALLKTLKGCGIFSESLFPVQIKSPDTRQEEHAGRNWHIAKVYFLKIKGESRKVGEPIQSGWMFHRYKTEADAFIQLEDGRKW